jgi:hypothetical protein
VHIQSITCDFNLKKNHNTQYTISGYATNYVCDFEMRPLASWYSSIPAFSLLLIREGIVRTLYALSSRMSLQHRNSTGIEIGKPMLS